MNTEARLDTPENSPALQYRSEHYPESWNGRVPLRIKMMQRVTVDWPLVLMNPKYRTYVAEYGEEYPAWVNSHGAVAAVLPDGETLGIKPDEFEVTAWHESR